MTSRVCGNKRGYFCLLSALLAGIFVVSFYYLEGVYPGSEKTILVYDEASQYIGIWQYVRHILSGQASFLWNDSICLGGDDLSQLAYYMGSPLNWIIAFFPITQMATVIYWLTISKFMTAAFAFSWYLLKAEGEKLKGRTQVTFGLAYALMSYMVIYAMCLMWLDGVCLLPFVLWGLERLIREDHRKTFIASLTVLFYVNYYTGYMIVLFTFLYLIFRAAEEGISLKDFGKKFLSYAKAGLIAAGLSSPILLPAILGTGAGKGQETVSSIWGTDGNIGKLLLKFCSCQYDSITNRGYGNFFVGTAMLVLVVLWLVLSGQSKRVKGTGLGICLFYILSMWLKPLILLWHGLHTPVCFPARFSFTFSAFLLILAERGLRAYEERVSGTDKNVVTVLNRYLVPLFYLFTAGELWLNGSYIVGAVRIECSPLKQSEIEEITEIWQKVSSSIDTEEGRVDEDIALGTNDAMLYGFDGLASFTSTYNDHVLKLLDSLGLMQHDYVVSGDGALPMIRSILGNRYYYSKFGADLYGFEEIYTEDTLHVYENLFSLSKAFMVSSDAETGRLSTEENIFFNNDTFTNALAGTGALWKMAETEVDLTEEDHEFDGTVTITVREDGPLYLTCTGSTREEYRENNKRRLSAAGQFGVGTETDQASFSLGDKQVASYDNAIATYPVYVCEAKAGDRIEITVHSNFTLGDFYAATMDEEKFKETIDILSREELTEEKKSPAILAGTVTAEEDGLLFTSIPYYEDLWVTVDGVRTKGTCLFDTFLGISLSAGSHEIAVYYVPKGLVIGLCLFALTLLILVGSFLVRGLHERKHEEKQ